MTAYLVNHDSPDLLLDSAMMDAAAQPSIRSQVIVTEVRGQKLAFPSVWVDEVMLFARHKILKLPFYREPVLGVVPHQGNLILLLDSPGSLTDGHKPVSHQENVRAIRLSTQVGDLAGTAIQIDKIIGTIHQADLEIQTTLQLFEPEKISLETLQPYRWI